MSTDITEDGVYGAGVGATGDQEEAGFHEPTAYEDKITRVTVDFSVTSVGAISMIFACSMIEVISAMKACGGMSCGGAKGWAVACGVISLVLTILFMIVQRQQPEVAEGPAGAYFSLFMVIWWSIGVGVLTFNEPFKATGNGYFASWLAFGMSISLASQMTEGFAKVLSGVYRNLTSGLERGLVVCIMVASLIEMISAAIICDAGELNGKVVDCADAFGFAVAAGVISVLVCCAAILKADLVPLKFVSLFLALWWTVCVGVLTFPDPYGVPFDQPGNGYFSTWVCFLASCYLAFLVYLSNDRGYH